ncbi:MAG: alpha/beta family hydrolase, partial [Jiangellaceae bacterium]
MWWLRNVDRLIAPTPAGDARLLVSAADDATATLVLGPGAGGSVEARDLVALTRAAPAASVTLVRVEPSWRVAGRRVAPRLAVLDEEWLAVLATMGRDVPLVVGGRSAGARVACRTARAVG